MNRSKNSWRQPVSPMSGSLAPWLVMALLVSASACGDAYGPTSSYNVTGSWGKVSGAGISTVVNFDLVEQTDGGVQGNGSAPNGTIKSFSISGVRQDQSLTLNLSLPSPTPYTGHMPSPDSLVMVGPHAATDSLTMVRR
jgi:hypothetical protein